MKTSLSRTPFDFVWTPQDELMALKPPMRYGRVEIALQDRIVKGTIERILGIRYEGSEEFVDYWKPIADRGRASYMLCISTSADLSNEILSNIGVRLVHEMPVDPSLRAAIRKSIEADYGKHTIIPGNQIPPVQRLPSKSLAINYLTGGGYPMGMMTRLWGAFSSGKTTEIFNTFAQAQKLGKSCLYVCSEKVFDEALAVRLGVDLSQDKFELVMERKIEVIGEIVQKALAGWHVIGVDSTTGTMSIDELATDKGTPKGVGDEERTTGMNRARKWGYNMDWWQDRINPENVLIFTSQIQSSIGMSTKQRIDHERAPGGEKLNHEPALILHFMKAQRLKRKPSGVGLEPIGDQGGDKGAFGRAEAAGGEVVVRCDKNKVGKQGRVVLLHHDKRTADFDLLWDYEKFAKYFGVVRRTSPQSTWYELPDGSRAQSVRSAIEESPELASRIQDTVLRCAQYPEFEDRLLRGNLVEELVPGVA